MRYVLPYDAAKWLITYKALKHEPPGRKILKTIREFTYGHDLHKKQGVDKSAVFRGVKLKRTAEWVLDKLVNDTPILLRTKPYESWSVSYVAAHEFSGEVGNHSGFGRHVSIVLFRKTAKPNSIIANLAGRKWWEDYLNLREIESDPQFSKIPGLIQENLRGFDQEFELLVGPQCSKCEFKRNVAWILAPLSFWMEYEERSGVPLYEYEHWGDRVFYFGTYNSRKKAVELFADKNGYGAVGFNEEFKKFARRRVGSTMREPF